MEDKWMMGRGERRSIITLVRDSAWSAPSTALQSPKIEEAYPVEFNAAIWTKKGWTVHLGETLSQPQIPSMAQSRWVQCAHLFSDAVVFLATDLSSASEMFLAWLACRLPPQKNRLFKPAARILIQKSSSGVEDFIGECATRWEAGTLTSGELKTGFFENIQIKQVKPIMWNTYDLPDTTVKNIAWKHIRESHKSVRRLRSSHGSLWNSSDFCRLALAWEASGSIPDDVALLTEAWPSGRFSLPKVLSSASDDVVRSSGQDFEEILTHRTALVGSYLMRHSFRSRHWTVPGESSQSNMFAENQFRLRYQTIAEAVADDLLTELKRSISAAPTKHYSSETVVDMIKRCWLEQTKTAYRTCESVLESARLHVKHLHRHREYLARLRYGGSCSACLLEPWTHTLPCKHGLCTLCLRACDGKETDGCRMIVNECPVCGLSVGSRCIRRFIPPTATLRVLALDGGGVKGLVQLQVLQYLCDEIGLRDTVHISTFFDLMVGSSIGGICALGLGTRKWSLEECKMKFLKFTEQIFAPKSCCGRLLSRFTGGWFAILSNVAKLILFDSIYDSAPIETILQESFGETSLMMQSDLEHPTRVAVVVNQASTSGPTVFANYNKSRHRKNGAYMWPAMNSIYRSLKIWEVARATSAAPGFWNTITLLSSVYQDGGLSHNNPSAIAINEANVLASSCDADSFIVSVGCGRLFTAPLCRMSVFRRYIKVFEETLDAERQHEMVKLLTSKRSESLMRLNPRLDMEEMSLDEQSSISSLDDAVQAMLISGSSAARIFSGECKAAARRLLASLFYFELGHKMMKGEAKDQNQQTGVIKTRLTKDEFKAFKQGYPEVKFRVKDLMFDVSISTEVKLWNPSSDTQFKIELVHPCWTQQIGGSPFTIAQLREAQADYLPVVLRNERKRKRG